MAMSRSEMDRRMDRALRLRSAGRRRRGARRRSPPMPSTTSSAGRPARRAAATPPGPFYEALCSPTSSDGKVERQSAASTATISWSTSRCGAARRRAGRSASRARRPAARVPPAARRRVRRRRGAMQRENVWIDMRAVTPAAAAGLIRLPLPRIVGPPQPEAAHPQGPAAGGVAADEARPEARPRADRRREAMVSRATAYRYFPRSRPCFVEAALDTAAPVADEVLRDATAPTIR